MKNKAYIRLFCFSLLRVVVTVLPLALTLFFNRGRYFTAPGQSVKLSIGGLICVILLFLAVIGKLQAPRRAVAVFMATVLSWLFAAIIHDLTLLLFMWLVGEVADLVVAPFARRAREDITINRAAKATARAVREELGGSGRV